MVLDPELIKLIEHKASVECGHTNLLYSSVYISQLTEHINGTCELTKHEIESKIDNLAGCVTITLDHPINELEFLRVRLCEGQNFTNVDELSYIKKSSCTFPKAGRLNLTGQALFYASVAVKQDDTALRVVLSEAQAKQLDHLNVLRSHQVSKTDLYLRIIGIWDQIRRNEKPYYLNQDTFDYYTEARKHMVKQFSRELLLAYELTDRFFADILSREGNERLYQVTSALSNMFLTDKCDGVLYSSVKAKGEPVVALKPQVVDDKLVHQFATEVLIDKAFGYEYYEYRTLAKTSSIGRTSGKLEW
ncbi:hypothetical protein CWB58_02005 [Pseudoalteromonas sp. S201]|uniref:hypothetical protein n=1 Tax=unclassified Pseudoalteromonas TaxID=194690 RepID=UPI0004056BB4|nr:MULTISPECIES: hypothetical protein [unclassified Pseudoalteromonas]TMS95080.1 hypothetical protein CWB58_02005 [Pseudoalteromonas sp. S201]